MHESIRRQLDAMEESRRQWMAQMNSQGRNMMCYPGKVFRNWEANAAHQPCQYCTGSRWDSDGRCHGCGAAGPSAFRLDHSPANMSSSSSSVTFAAP